MLKTLDEDSWDDTSIDSLLAGADSNGDGALQVVEFLSWILGPTWVENPEHLSVAVSMKLSTTSNPAQQTIKGVQLDIEFFDKTLDQGETCGQQKRFIENNCHFCK